MPTGLTILEMIAIGNFILNLLIVPLAVFAWRITVAVVKMEQILINHAERLTRVEGVIDEASRSGKLERRR